MRMSFIVVGQLCGGEYYYMRRAMRRMDFGSVDGYAIWGRLLQVTDVRKEPCLGACTRYGGSGTAGDSVYVRAILV